MYVDYCGDDRSCEIREFIDERFCKRHKFEQTKKWLNELYDYAQQFSRLHPITCQYCNEVGHFNIQCMYHHDRIITKYYENDGMITAALSEVLSLFLW